MIDLIIYLGMIVFGTYLIGVIAGLFALIETPAMADTAGLLAVFCWPLAIAWWYILKRKR